MTFSVPGGVTTLTPFEWCNKHGLYKGTTVTIPNPTTVDPSDPSCGISAFETQAWESVHADFVRLQRMPPHNSEVPFTETGGAKHTPYITLDADGKTASILVGDTAVAVHPMNGSPDGEVQPHWITEVYVMDQSGEIVTMQTLDSTGVFTATAEFDVPEGAETLQAYAWCNLHGLWQGPVVEVVASASADTEDNSGVACSVAVGAVAGTSLLAAIGV